MKKLIISFLAVLLSSSIHSQVPGKDTIPEAKVPPTYKAKLVEGLRNVEYDFWFKGFSNLYGVEYTDSSASRYVRTVSLNSGDTKAKTYKVVPLDEVPKSLIEKAKLNYLGFDVLNLKRAYFRNSKYLFEVRGFLGMQIIEVI